MTGRTSGPLENPVPLIDEGSLTQQVEDEDRSGTGRPRFTWKNGQLNGGNGDSGGGGVCVCVCMCECLSVWLSVCLVAAYCNAKDCLIIKFGSRLYYIVLVFSISNFVLTGFRSIDIDS